VEPADDLLLGEELRDIIGVFLLVFPATVPVALPFLVLPAAGRALRVSHATALAMLFIAGYAYGRITGWRPWLVGISMVIIGAALVAMTMALGG
jgi:VIT1/CCC1 family predicted Fe2+/Mn2+ transporter